MKQALDKESRISTPERLARMAAASRLISSLEGKGMLRKQTYQAASRSDLERRYLSA